MKLKWRKYKYCNLNNEDVISYSLSFGDSFLDIDKCKNGWLFVHNSGYGQLIKQDPKIYETLKEAQKAALLYANKYAKDMIENINKIKLK